jgi:hypothetical protein
MTLPAHGTVRPGTVALVFVVASVLAFGQQGTVNGPAPAPRIRDMLWVWGNPEMTAPGDHTLATFASASPARRAELLGVPNVVMAGYGIPNDDAQADALTRAVSAAPHLVWEISADGAGGPPFVYTQRLAQVRRLVDRYPQLEGVLIDDLSTVAIDKGLLPEHIRQIRQGLDGKYAAVKLWGGIYTMSFGRARLDEYIRELDVIVLATWHARDLVNLEENVTLCGQRYPDKAIVLCLYLYDYGDGRRMPPELLQQQCDTALRLARARRIRGIIFLTINDDPEAVGWTAAWIRQLDRP